MLSVAAGEAALGGGSIFGKLDPSGTGLMGQKPDTHFEHNPLPPSSSSEIQAILASYTLPSNTPARLPRLASCQVSGPSGEKSNSCPAFAFCVGAVFTNP